MLPYSTKQKAYSALVITSIVWGTTWVAMKFGLKQLPALQLASIRQFIAGGLFVGFFMVFKHYKLPTLQEFKKIFFLCVLTFTLANAVSTWSLKYISSGLGALIGTLYPLSVAVIEYAFFGNKNINKLTIFGIVLGFCGIAYVFYDSAFHVAHGSGFLFGILLAFIAMFAWSFSTILVAKKYLSINPYYGMGWQMVISSVLVFIASLFTQKNIPLSSISLESWGVIFYLIIMGSIVAVVAFVYSMKYLNPAVAALYAYVNPFIAMFIGSYLLNEKVTLKIILGSVITLIGVYLVNLSMKEKAVLDSETL
jgi:drug/metabolite transporter (DMT)-like permease